MAKPLQSASVAAPGFYGLNTQESSVTLAAGFALQADNCVIDKFGRLGARKGWQVVADSVSNLQGAHRFLDINGTEYFGCWNDTGFYIYDGSATLQSVTYVGDNTITTGNWQAATLNDAAFLFQSGYKPVYFSPTAGNIDDVEHVTNNFVPEANTVLSAYGRLWAANTVDNKTTVWWSNLLDGTDFQTGTSGSVDISSVLVNGNDRIVALGAQNGNLIIFCERNIIIYGDKTSGETLDPADLRLVEVISGVGCVARDSVQNTGTDILFLSAEGVRSLGRVIQEKSLPMRDITKNVRDDLVREVSQHSKDTIKSVYSPEEAFYLLLLPEYQRMYCIDMRGPLQDGSARVTLWDKQVHSNMMSVDDGLYFTNDEGLCRYYGYTDDGNSYTIKYYTNYFDFDNATAVKYLKRLGITLIGGSGQDFVLKAGYDYSDAYQSFPLSIETRANAEYGVAEYNTAAEYTVGTLSDTVRAPIGGSGNVVQVGFEATIEGAELSIQKLDIYVKQGRTY